jgi:hypothetical protein
VVLAVVVVKETRLLADWELLIKDTLEELQAAEQLMQVLEVEVLLVLEHLLYQTPLGVVVLVVHLL